MIQEQHRIQPTWPWGLYKTIFGPLNTKWVGHNLEISAREVIAIAPLMALMLAIGIYPYWLVNVINEAVTRLLAG